MLNHSLSFVAKRWCVLLGGAALTALAGCSAGPPQELRGPGPQAGQNFRTETKLTVTDGRLAMRAGSQKLEGTCEMVTTIVVDNEILAVEGRQVTKHQSTIVANESKTSMKVGGQAHAQTERAALRGEKILHERQGWWRNSLVGKTPTAKQKKELAFLDPLENEDELYPEGQVKPGYTWKVDGARLRKFLGAHCTALSGEAAMTFERTTTFGGESCALIRLTMNVKGKVRDLDSNELSVELNVKGSMHRSLKSGYDVKHSVAGTMKLGGTVTSGKQRVQMEMDGPVTLEATTKLK